MFHTTQILTAGGEQTGSSTAAEIGAALGQEAKPAL